MILKRSIAFLLAIPCITSFAGSPDKYYKKISEARSDTSVLNAYNSLTEFYLDDIKDSAEFYNKTSVEFSGDNGLDYFNYKGFFLKATLEKDNGKLRDALETVATAIEVAKTNKNFFDEIEALNLKGSILQKAQQGKLALAVFKSCYDRSKLLKEQKALMISAMHLGLYYKEDNDITNALAFLVETAPIADQLNDTNGIFTCCINLGSLYERTKDNEKALSYYRRALAMNGDNSDDENAKAICYFKIGRLFTGMDKQDSAEYYLHKTMDIHLKRKDERGLVFDYSFLASIYTNMRNLKKAEAYYDTSMALAMKLQDSLRISAVYTYKGNTYEKLGEDAKALESYQNSLSFLTKKAPSETIMAVYKNIAGIYTRQGKYKEALDNYVLFKAWADSSHNINEIKKQTEIKLAFEFNQVQEKMKAEADAKELVATAQLEKEKQQRYFLFAVLGLITIFLFLAIRSYRSKRVANRQLEKQKKRVEKQKEQLEDKQMEILNSFHYAKRIQDSLLPSEKYIERNLRRLRRK